MRVAQLGDGTPEVAVVGGVHGDEPSGVRAVERLLDERPAVERPVKLVVANEAAVERGLRFVDVDLNRSFPGDPDGPTHESRLAARLAEEVEDCTTLALHATRSHPEPFAVVDGLGPPAERIVPHLSVVAAVDAADHVEGRLFASGGVVEVEAGLQGSDLAAENAHAVAREFLAATGALDAPATRSPVPVYRLTGRLPKAAADEHEVFVDNFERVEHGAAYAAADGERVVADEAFYPVLVSATGYADVFGYAAERAGTLE